MPRTSLPPLPCPGCIADLTIDNWQRYVDVVQQQRRLLRTAWVKPFLSTKGLEVGRRWDSARLINAYFVLNVGEEHEDVLD
jgi:hypothetical protein